jgi:hypothetical protein
MPTYIILPLTHYKTVVYFNSYFAHIYDTTINTLHTCGLLYFFMPTYIRGLLLTRKLLNQGFLLVNKGNNKITELRTILQRESQNS